MFVSFLLILVNFTPVKHFKSLFSLVNYGGGLGEWLGVVPKICFTKLFLYGYQKLHAQTFFIWYLTFNQTHIRIKYLLFKHIKYSERFKFEFL